MNSPRDSHVAELVADFVFGRLEGDELQRVREHLEQCSECAQDFAAAVTLRQASEEAQHLSEQRIAQLSDSPDILLLEEREHLESCARCSHELSVLRDLGAAPDLSDRSRQPRRAASPAPRARLLQQWVAPAMVLAATIAFLLLPRGIDPTELAQLEPMPVRLSRTAPQPDSFEAARLAGLSSYVDEDWSGAIASFELALRMRPGIAELRLYRASANALRGEPELARDELGDLVADATLDATTANEARWQLAQLELAAGEAQAARELLGEIVDSRGHRARNAQELLNQL